MLTAVGTTAGSGEGGEGEGERVSEGEGRREERGGERLTINIEA